MVKNSDKVASRGFFSVEDKEGVCIYAELKEPVKLSSKICEEQVRLQFLVSLRGY